MLGENQLRGVNYVNHRTIVIGIEEIHVYCSKDRENCTVSNGNKNHMQLPIF